MEPIQLITYLFFVSSESRQVLNFYSTNVLNLKYSKKLIVLSVNA